MIRFNVKLKSINTTVSSKKPVRMTIEQKPIRMTVENKTISMAVNPQKSIQMKVEKAVAISVEGNTYEGSYEVTPTVDGLTMETKEKYMKDNVTVNPIPFFSVGNNSGGNTVYIGNEV